MLVPLRSDIRSDLVTRQPVVRLETVVGKLFRGVPSFKSVVQGELGDCWLAAYAAALAHVDPKRIQTLFETVPGEKDRIRIRLKSVWEPSGWPIEMDNALYSASDGTLQYGRGAAKGKAPELWFPFLEKAVAQLRGDYNDLVAQSPALAAELMTGATLVQTQLDPRKTVDLLTNMLAQKVPIVVARSVETAEVLPANTGLVPDHAYTVLGLTQNDVGQTSIQIRNPWGTHSVAGRTIEDGIFEVPVETFVQFFNYTWVPENFEARL
jgi:hypothetical protein